MAQLVEHHLAKVRVAGSNPVVRSRKSQVKGCIPFRMLPVVNHLLRVFRARFAHGPMRAAGNRGVGPAEITDAIRQPAEVWRLGPLTVALPAVPRAADPRPQSVLPARSGSKGAVAGVGRDHTCATTRSQPSNTELAAQAVGGAESPPPIPASKAEVSVRSTSAKERVNSSSVRRDLLLADVRSNGLRCRRSTTARRPDTSARKSRGRPR